MRIHESSEKACREVEVARADRENSSGASRSMEGASLSNREAGDAVSLQSIAENAHNETKSDVLEQYEGNIPNHRREFLESPSTSERLRVLSSENYTNLFPENGPLVLGHCDSEGNIYIKATSESAVSHISTHETMHLCSNRESGLNEKGNWSIKSGLRETEISPNRSVVSDTGRGINEGTTELYTLRELNRRGESEAARAFDSYPQSREWAERLEQLVGEEHLADGYFGGKKEALEQEFNQLDTESQNGWKAFEKNVDIVEYSSDAEEIQRAQRALAEQYFRMILEKDLRGEGE